MLMNSNLTRSFRESAKPRIHGPVFDNTCCCDCTLCMRGMLFYCDVPHAARDASFSINIPTEHHPDHSANTQSYPAGVAELWAHVGAVFDSLYFACA